MRPSTAAQAAVLLLLAAATAAQLVHNDTSSWAAPEPSPEPAPMVDPPPPPAPSPGASTAPSASMSRCVKLANTTQPTDDDLKPCWEALKAPGSGTDPTNTMLSLLADMFAQCMRDAEDGPDCSREAGGCNANAKDISEGGVIGGHNGADAGVITGGTCKYKFDQIAKLQSADHHCAHCTTEFTWSQNSKLLKFGGMCDKNENKLCYPNPTKCSAATIKKMYSGGYFVGLARKCYNEKRNSALIPSPWPDMPALAANTACDLAEQFVPGNAQWFALAFALVLVLVSIAMVRRLTIDLRCVRN